MEDNVFKVHAIIFAKAIRGNDFDKQNTSSFQESADAESYCWETLVWTTRLVPFGSFLGASGDIYDALLTLLSDMPPSIATAEVTAQFFSDPDAIETASGKAKLKRLMSHFRSATLGEAGGIEDATSEQPLSVFYRQKCFEWEEEIAEKERLFGRAPHQLFTRPASDGWRSDLESTECPTPPSVGSFGFETSAAYLKFLDTFFLITFLKTLCQRPSNPCTPLLLPYASNLVAPEMKALTKLKNKADTEGATKPPHVSRLSRSQSFNDVRTSRPVSGIVRLQSEQLTDVKRSSSLGDVNKVGGTSGMQSLGKQILDFLPRLVWLSRWSTQSSSSHSRLSFVGAGEGLSAMRVSVPLPLLVNCLWLLRNVYLAWACNTEVNVDITVQRGDLLHSVTDGSPAAKEETLKKDYSTLAKPKRSLGQFECLSKSLSESNIPEIVVLSPTTDEEGLFGVLGMEKGNNNKKGKSKENRTKPPVAYHSDSGKALPPLLGNAELHVVSSSSRSTLKGSSHP